MTNAIIFDLDGTLIDSAPDIHAGLQTILADEGIRGTTYEETQSFIGRGVKVFIERALQSRGIALDPELVERLRVKFHHRYETEFDLTSLYPAALETLQNLASQGYTLGLCTNKPEKPTFAVLEHFGMTSLFKALSFGDGPYAAKPNPEPLEYVINLLGSEKVLYVGDSETDEATANNADVEFALFTKGYRKAPVEEFQKFAAFDDYTEFTEIVGRFFG